MSETDYYEILGVRPTAGREEIELAYKGRRSQYHPDRYTQSDAETQAWATGKMQDVNKAYAVLKDQAERSRFDQGRDSRPSRPAPPPASTPEPARSMTLKQVLDGYKPASGPFEKIFVAPNIPKQKLSGAIANYGEGLRPRDVLALIDDTAFGGAKEGILITENEIRFKAIFEPVLKRKFERIEEIGAERNRVYINGHEIAKLNMPEKREVEAFFELVNGYFKQCAVDAGDRENNGGTREGYEDAEHVAGERHFVGLKQGFYNQLERTIQRDIATARTKEERVTLELVSQLLPVSKSLEGLARSNGVPLSGAERSLVSSDMMRFELLIYVMSVIEDLLSREAGLDQDQISEILAPVANRLLLAYIVEIEGIGEQRTLRSIANPLAELENSFFFREFKRRWRRYALLFQGAAGSLAEDFDRSLRKPTAFNAYETPQRVNLHQFAGNVIGRVLDEQSIPAFLLSVGEDVESALVNMFEKA